jgi:predicted transcriptional regulator
MSNPSKKKLTVNLSSDIVDVLKSLAETNNSTMTDELKRAISDRKFFADQTAAGSKIILENAEEPNIRTIVELR